MKPEYLEALKRCLRYDPGVGEFYWLIHTHDCGGAIEPGDRAGTPKDGYIQIGFDGRCCRRARLAWLFMTGDFPPKGCDIDHVDQNKSNDRWGNLRLLSRSRNVHNVGRPRSDNTRVRVVYIEQVKNGLLVS